MWPASLHKYLYCEANPVNSVDPSGRMWIPSNWTYGNRVQAEIAAHFERFGPPGEKFTLYRPISTILGVRYIAGLTASKPDLVLMPGAAPGSPGQVWEIKPFGSFAEGTAQLWFYIALLNYFDRAHTWVPGSSYVPPSVIPIDYGVFALVAPPAGGVILYQVENVLIDCMVLAVYGAHAGALELQTEVAADFALAPL